jgi:molecular chaperone GrpE
MQQSGPEWQDADIPQDEATAQGASTPSLEQQLAETRQRQRDCLDALRRSQADFLNYKRRVGQEQAEGRAVAQTDLLATLLPVLDDLGRALEATPADLAEQPWVQGLHLVARRLTQTLQQLGVRQVGAPGESFDPSWHEAVLTEPRADLPEGTVVQVTRPGYALGKRVLRPAQVVVAAPSPTAVGSSEG